MELDDLKQRVRRFSDERDWGQFHDPKNLSMALAAEAGELLEVFQWMTTQEARDVGGSAELVGRAGEELADVLIYAVRLADVIELDLDKAVEAKLVSNAERYPIETARGSAAKAQRSHS